jgi:predicted transcriptional regulator
MIDMLKRHEIQVLRRADHTWSEIAALSGVSEKTVRRIATEDFVATADNATERARRQMGRPSKAEGAFFTTAAAPIDDLSATFRAGELANAAAHVHTSGGPGRR